MARSTTQNPLRETIRLGIGGAKSNLVPGAVLWLIGLTLVISYYQLEPVATTFDQIGRWKAHYSPWFAMLSTATFGSLIPWLAQVLFIPAEKQTPRRQVLPLFLFWGIHGWQVDQFYQIQSALFGTAIDFQTIATKTLVDEFVWVPFLAIPQVVLCYLFIENDLSPKRFRAALKETPFLTRAIPLMIANWVVWIPSVTLIYLFPLSLQLPLQNIILALWCLIISFFTKNA